MTDISSNSTYKTLIENPVIKALLGIFNFLLPFAVLAAFFFALFGTIWVVADPLGALLPESLLIAIVLMGGAHTSRHAAFNAKREAAEKVRLQQTSGTEVDDEALKTMNMPVPDYLPLLKRNAIIAVFYAPVLLIISAIAMAILTGIMGLTQEFAQSGTIQNRTLLKGSLRLMLTCLVPFPFFGWIAGVSVAGDRIAKWVDHRILHTTFEFPENEETRNKRKQREQMKALREAAGESKGQTVVKQVGYSILGNLASTGVMLVLFFIPMLLVVVGLQNSSLSDGVKNTIYAVVTIGYGFFLMIMLPRVFLRTMHQRTRQHIEDHLEKAKTVEEVDALEEVIEEIDRSQKIQEKSIESRLFNRMFTIFIGGMGGVILIGMLAGIAVRSSGMDGKAAEGVISLVWIIGIILVLVFSGSVMQRFIPKSVGEKLLTGWEAALRTGDYPTMLQIVKDAMKELPTWETRLPGAATYMQVGRFEDGERIARELLHELSKAPDESRREMAKPIISQLQGLLAEMYIYQDDFENAQAMIDRALVYDNEGYALHNTVAKLHLFLKNPQAAMPHLDQAEKAYRDEKRDPSAYHLALRAWAAAQMGDTSKADSLMLQAFKQTPTEHVTDVAELYLFGGYIARAESKFKGADLSFKKAVELDPEGINGIVARRELGQ